MSSAPARPGLAAALRRLLVVAAALALIGHGGVELAPRLVSATAGVMAAAPVPPAAARPAAESTPVERGTTLRAALAMAAAVPATAVETAAGPGSSLLLAPHLASRPVARPPTTDLQGAETGASGRAPPSPAGT